MGAAVGAFVAAAAMATGSAAPAKADFEDLLDPIIQPLLTSFTDSVAVFDPAAALDLTSWTDSLLASLNTSFDFALPTTDTAAAAATTAAEPAAAAAATYDLPITLSEGTEPTVNAAVDGGSSLPVLVDSGSSGLVVPYTDLGSNPFSQLESLFSLGTPTGISESGYSGGVDYIYLTYNSVPVSYADGLGTTGPVEVEVYSWDPSNFLSYFTNDAFQTFLSGNASEGGILGIGDNVGGAAGASPFDSYGSALVDLKHGELVIGGTNPYSVLDTVSGNGSIGSGLTETVTTNTGAVVGSSAVPVSDDLDTGGVYGTIPSSISSSGLAQGDIVTVSEGSTVLYSYAVGAGGSPDIASGTTIDSGVEPFLTHALYIDYAHDTTSLDVAGS
ncbi:hypothetical protein [Mycobacterium sp.]|uniref:hypothetical protein n=1 Tax=Mycobacterium sp. TaxID=1785 RepID=UPI003D0A1828